MAEKAAPLLIDQIRDLPKKESYTTVSVKQGFTEKCFNGVVGITTRKIRICGVKLEPRFGASVWGGWMPERRSYAVHDTRSDPDFTVWTDGRPHMNQKPA